MTSNSGAAALAAGSSTPPFITVSGVPNFRDLGNYLCATQPSPPLTDSSNDKQEALPGSNLRCIRPGFLFRSAQPSQITPAGIEILTHNLNIQATFDFRSQTEIQLVVSRYPDSLLEIPGTTRFAVPVFKEGDFSPVSLAKKYGAPSKSATDPQSSPAEAKRGGFVQAYEDIARNAAENGSFRKIIDHILQYPERPILFHCTLGKDRTGVFAALLMKLCGVADDKIIEDYALTTEGLGSWREHLIQRLLQRQEAKSRDEAEFIIASRPENMQYFLTDVVQAKFGGARQYFTKLCGMSEGEVDRLISIIVVPKLPSK